MRKVLMFFAPIVFLTLASAALADNVDFTATSTVAPSGPSFTLTFSEPSSLTSLNTFTTVDLSSGGSSSVFPGNVVFFDLADLGLFDVYMGSSVFEFFGAQSYSGTTAPFSLLTGTFPVTGGDIVENGVVTDLLGGTVTATPAVATPEPATLALLVSGLFAIGVLRRKKCFA